MEQFRLVELTPISDRLLGATVAEIGRLAAVSEAGAIPLTGTLVLDTDLGYVTLHYSQEGLSVRGPEQLCDIRWATEPDLTLRDQGNAEEWIELIPVENQTDAPDLPLHVDAVSAWFGIGAYLDTFGILLTSGDRTLVVMTTDSFDLIVSNRQDARQRAELVAANMNLRLIEQEQRLSLRGRRALRCCIR
ncbi:hypothetical protein [Nocardia brasiliensis]|uniref:hypothetical protein n=1 Tax=Nocardia brasiliensis TaxID=37326 RepID=UPI0011DCCC7F|nr:hypothetical protein [Nocardia brasiliensis]